MAELRFFVREDRRVTRDTIAPAARAGADVFVAGTAVFGASDYGKAIDELRRLAEDARRA